MTEPQAPQPSYPSYPGSQPTPPGFPGYYPGAPSLGDPNVRPGSVTAAGWIAIILSGLGLIGSLALLSVTSRAVDYVIEHPEELDVQAGDLPAAADLRAVISVFAVVLIVASVAGILVAIATLKRQGWARIALVVFSGLTAFPALIFSLALIGVPWLAGTIAVIVLLFTSKANAWFRAGGTQQL